MGRKLRKCRICKKSPVWRGGDVKEPGPFCKKCYHKHISPGRQRNRKERSQLEPLDEFADYRERQEFLDFLGLDNLQEHLALESFRYYMGTNYLQEYADFDDPRRREEIDIPQMDPGDDEEIPF